MGHKQIFMFIYKKEQILLGKQIWICNLETNLIIWSILLLTKVLLSSSSHSLSQPRLADSWKNTGKEFASTNTS